MRSSSGIGEKTSRPGADAGAGGARRRRVLLAGVAVAAALAVLLALGSWQMVRLDWKTDLLDRIAARMSADPVPLPAGLDDPDAWDYRRVVAVGTFHHDAELHLGPRVQGGRPGYHVLTPLVLAAEEAGAWLLVNRGWVPADLVDAESRPDSLPPGQVTVTGIARVPAGRGWLTPADQPERNMWFAIDLPAMAAATGLPDLLPVVLEADPGPAGTLPVGGQTRLAIPNDHLQYALTWYGLAAVLVVMAGLAWLRRSRSTAGPAGSGPSIGSPE